MNFRFKFYEQRLYETTIEIFRTLKISQITPINIIT